MSGIDLLSVITITAPSASDGRGEIAVLNDSTSGNFVGLATDASGFDGPAVRSSMEDLPEAHGATFSPFFHGPRSFTLEVEMAIASTTALTIARRDKLYRASNMMAADGSIVYTETGGSARLISCRREQPPRGPVQADRKVLLAFIAADPRILASAAATAGPGTFSIGGNAGTLPTFTITAPTNTIVLSRTSPSPTESLTLTGLSGAGTVTVNFSARTVTASSGASNRYSAISFPSSVFWELVPGSNTVSVTGGTVSASGISYRNAWI